MICLGCQVAADQAMVDTFGLSGNHDPFLCTMVDCFCQHGMKPEAVVLNV